MHLLDILFYLKIKFHVFFFVFFLKKVVLFLLTKAPFIFNFYRSLKKSNEWILKKSVQQNKIVFAEMGWFLCSGVPNKKKCNFFFIPPSHLHINSR